MERRQPNYDEENELEGDQFANDSDEDDSYDVLQ